MDRRKGHGTPPQGGGWSPSLKGVEGPALANLHNASVTPSTTRLRHSRALPHHPLETPAAVSLEKEMKGCQDLTVNGKGIRTASRAF